MWWILRRSCFNGLYFFKTKSALLADKSASGSGIKNQNMLNKRLAEELHKPIIRKITKTIVYSQLL